MRLEGDMLTVERAIEVYLRLARACDKLARPAERDNYLLLAAQSAWNCGRSEQAERLRFLLLRHNPDHLLKPYGSFAEATEARDVQAFVRQLQRNHPPDAAERLMERLEPETESAQRGITETASLGEAKTRHDLLLPESESASKPGAARAPALPPAAAAPAARGSKQKEASKMADMHQPRPPAPDPRRPPPPTARPAPNVFSVVPDDRPRPRPAMGPIGGLAPPRTDTGGGWIGLLLAIVVFAIGIALLAVTFVNPFFPLGF